MGDEAVLGIIETIIAHFSCYGNNSFLHDGRRIVQRGQILRDFCSGPPDCGSTSTGSSKDKSSTNPGLLSARPTGHDTLSSGLSGRRSAWLLGLFTEPARVVLLLEDHRHAIVHVRDDSFAAVVIMVQVRSHSPVEGRPRSRASSSRRV